MPNQYQQVGNGVSHLGQVAQQIALGLAQQRQQQQRMQADMQLKLREQAMQEALAQQRGQLMGQQGRQAESVTGFNNARAGQVANTESSKGQLKDAMWNAGMVQAGQNQGVDMGPRSDIAIARVMEAMGGLPSSAFDPTSMAQMMQMNNPRAQQMMATGTKMNASVGPGAMLFDTLNQQPLIQSPRALNEGQVLRPNEAGSQGLPKTFSPQNNNNLFGSLVNLLGQGRVSGVVTEPNNPINQQAAKAIQALLPQLMQNITNGPANPRIGLQGGAAQLQAPQAQMVAPKDKAALANQLSQQNPTWTREQVINAVKQQLGE